MAKVAVQPVLTRNECVSFPQFPDRLVILQAVYGAEAENVYGNSGEYGLPISLKRLTGDDSFEVIQPGCLGCGEYCLGFKCFDRFGALPTRTFTRIPGTNDFQSPGLMGPEDNQTATIISSNPGTGWFLKGYGCRLQINGAVYDTALAPAPVG